MRYLTVEEVIFIHEYQLEKFGGLDGILSLELLESAIHRPKTSFGGKEKFKNVFEKTASLTQSIIKNHPFVDGNKRTGIVAGIMLLSPNGYELKISQEAVVKVARDIESDKISLKEIAEFYREYAAK